MNYFKLGRYLGLSIDIGLVSMAKIIKVSGQFLNGFMYQALNQEEWEQEEYKAEHSLFMESLHQRLGPHAMVRDLVELDVEDVSQYDPYDNKLQNV